jgi:hypothetical protein
MLGFDVVEFLLGLLHVFLKVFLLFECPLASCSCYFSFHQLNLIFSIIQKFLLFLEFLVQLVDVGLQVSASCHNSLNFSIKRCFTLSKLSELLSVSDQEIFLHGDLRLNFFPLVLSLLKGRLSLTLGHIKLLNQKKFILEFSLKGVKLGLLYLKPLFLL